MDEKTARIFTYIGWYSVINNSNFAVVESAEYFLKLIRFSLTVFFFNFSFFMLICKNGKVKVKPEIKSDFASITFPSLKLGLNEIPTIAFFRNTVIEIKSIYIYIYCNETVLILNN